MRAYAVAIVLVIVMFGCGGGSGGGGDGDGGGGGVVIGTLEITIDDPTESDSLTMPIHAGELVVGGYVSESPYGKIKGVTSCYCGLACLEYPYAPGCYYTPYYPRVDVNVTNQATGETKFAHIDDGRQAPSESSYRWSVSVPLVIGTNEIVVDADDGEGYRGSDFLIVSNPVDAEAPSVPTNVKAIYDPQSVANPTINLSWQAAYDNSGTVPAYRIYRDGAILAQVSGLGYSDAGLGANKHYCYTVAALDSTNNESAPSSPECVTTSWILKTLDSTVQVQWTAIDVDSGDNLHIAYYDGQYTGSNQQTGTVKYATNLSGAWQSVAIDSVAPIVYGSISLVANADASLNIAYYDFNQYLLKRAVKTSGAWLTEEIALNLLNVTTVAMAHDASSKLHLIVNPNGDLTYMSNATGSWTSEVIGSNGVIYGNAATCAIAVDAVDKAHVGYYDYANRILKYVSNKSGEWTTETVDSITDAGLYTAIALDTDGYAHLSYYDVTNGDLKYATNLMGSWVTQIIDSVGDVGQSSAIASDANGHVHISYTDATNDALKYATNASGSWMTVVIDNATNVAGNLSYPGAYTSLAVDSSGKVHISYRGDEYLRYATNR